MKIKSIVYTTLLSSMTLLAQNSVGLNINSDDIEVSGSINLNSLSGYNGGTTFVLGGSYLNTPDESLFSIGISGENQLATSSNIKLAFGFKSVMTTDYISIPFTAKATVGLPLNHSIPSTSLVASFAYAPSILSFSDAKNYTEFRLEGDMEVISNIHLFTGYRNIQTDYESKEVTFDSGFYAGMVLKF